MVFHDLSFINTGRLVADVVEKQTNVRLQNDLPACLPTDIASSFTTSLTKSHGETRKLPFVLRNEQKRKMVTRATTC